MATAVEDISAHAIASEEILQHQRNPGIEATAAGIAESEALFASAMEQLLARLVVVNINNVDEWYVYTCNVYTFSRTGGTKTG